LPGLLCYNAWRVKSLAKFFLKKWEKVKPRIRRHCTLTVGGLGFGPSSSYRLRIIGDMSFEKQSNI